MIILVAIGVFALFIFWLFGSKNPPSLPPSISDDRNAAQGEFGLDGAKPKPARPPTAMAEERLDKQIADLKGQLNALQPKKNKRLESALNEFRRQWVRDQLQQEPIESIEISGFGGKGFQALRKAGVKSVADLEGIRGRSIAQIGKARAKSLEDAFDKYQLAAEQEFAALSGDQVNDLSGGDLADLFREGREQEQTRQRKRRAIEVRLAELRRRLSDLKRHV